MKYNNRLYPYPVLGILDDIEGEFSCNLSVESNRKEIILKPAFHISNHDIEKLIKSGGANICLHLYCRGTLYRKNWIIKDLISDEIKIDSNNLNGETEVDFFICSNSHSLKYKNSQSNKVFNNEEFELEKGDILAYGGKGKFFANKSPEQLKAVSSIMRIKKGKFKNGPFFNDYDDKYIIVHLSETDYELYHDLKENKKYINILHTSIVLPSLLEAVYFINNEESGASANKENEWYKILEKNINEAKGNTILEKIQNVLDLPLNREFLSLENLESSYE